MISVIIPMFNSEKTIIRSIKSVLNQTRLDLVKEIIVVDDGSNDRSYELVKNYVDANNLLFLKILKQNNKGVSSARNLGMRICTGSWIALLDSDDEWVTNKIELQVKQIFNFPSIDFIGGNSEKKQMKILFKKIPYLYQANIRDLCLKTFPPTPTALFKKSIIKEIGYFDENQHYGEDMNYFNKICLKFNYYHLQEQLVLINRGTSRKMHEGLSSNLLEMHKGNIKNIKELLLTRDISYPFYLFLRCFYLIKLVRRHILWKLI